MRSATSQPVSSLTGSVFRLPEGYKMLVLVEQSTTGSSQQDHNDCGDAEPKAGGSWTASHSMDQVTLWGHDQAPHKSDTWRRALEFLSVAQKVGERERDRRGALTTLYAGARPHQ